MNWQSAEVLANVDKFILDKGYGCNANITTGDADRNNIDEEQR